MVGSESIDGVPTTGYRADIDFGRVPDALPAASRAAVEGLEQLSGIHNIPVVVWIDARHLVRRVQYAFNENLPTGQTLNTFVTVDVTQYGPQPAPVLPPASQVQDLTLPRVSKSR
jgi:hypothetical protein